MKPFNLEKALAGDPVVTRDGKDITQLHLFDCEGFSHPLMGVSNGLVYSWTAKGIYSANNQKTSNDLFMKSKTVVKWVNIYKDAGGLIYFTHSSEREANESASEFPNRLGNKAHRIEWDE